MNATVRHVVMVPGFAGFDALGQIEYYAGVTPRFDAWRRAHPEQRVVLRYFDNFPTAGVRTRARRLARYIAKRMVRGEFAEGDILAFVGHSTGGLDIRQLLTDLRTDAFVPVDSGQRVETRAILSRLREARIVFLSVPQFGTNLADWVRAHSVERRILVAGLRAAVEAAQWPALDAVPDGVTWGAEKLTGSDALRAVRKALDDIDADLETQDATAGADAHEAAALLELWLRHIESDFGAIDDLSCRRDGEGPRSPAHATRKMREAERRGWRSLGIVTRSYATRSPRLFELAPGPVAEWALARPWDLFTRRTGARSDALNLVCYRACAGGPFRVPDDPAVQAAARMHKLEPWDNDGIVNTASMLWPDHEATALLECDHMDVVGHYASEPFRYDLLGSGSGFGASAFAALWDDVFSFCAFGKRARERRLPA